MKKANVEKLEHMAATYLQFLYSRYLHYRNHDDPDSTATQVAWQQYSAACDMLVAFGATWLRKFNGNTSTNDLDISNYEHQVKFPTDAQCDKLNLNAWTN